MSVAGFAALCALVVLLFGDFLGFAIGLAVSVSGLVELVGSRLLQRKELKSIVWLTLSQLYLIVVLWAYSIYQLRVFEPDNPWAIFSPEFKDLILSINPDAYLIEALIRITYPATYFALILVVLIYQGGLCIYYLSRKKYLYADRH